ncbi:MAG: enoyl-CoA hydratase/isomerase family protein [Candidatus Thorarchaeota archaeon]
MSQVELKKENQIALITINNPPANALNPEIFSQLREILTELDQDDTKVIIITGAGDKFFIGGANIKQFTEQDAKGAEKLARIGQKFTLFLEQHSKVIIMAVNGYCLGGGMELSQACDFVIASDNARFGQTEIKLGIIPGWGGTQRLQRWMNPQHARELILTGDIVPASQMGNFVYKVVPQNELIPTAMELAKRITSRGLVAIKLAKKALKQALYLPIEEGLKLEARYFGQSFESEDAKEGIKAFLEKRDPKVVDK